MNLPFSAVGFALLSLLFAGLIDVAYKLYSRKERSRGMYLLGMGLVWGLLQLLALRIQGQSLAMDASTVGFGVAAGLMVTLSNLLLIESLTHLNVSLGSTIYRLNTIGVVILSFLFLGEHIGSIKLLGVGTGIFAALLLYQYRRGEPGPTILSTFFWVAVFASLLRAGFGVTSKAGLAQGASASTMLLIAAACWVIGGFFYALLRERRVRITRKKLVYSAVSGILVFLIVNTLILALERGEASVVVPIANLSFVVALTVSVLTKMERLSLRKATAVACAALAIFLLSHGS